MLGLNKYDKQNIICGGKISELVLVPSVTFKSGKQQLKPILEFEMSTEISNLK